MINSNYRNLIENLYEGLFYVDKNRRIKFWSKGAEKITGYSKYEAINNVCSEDFLNPTDADGKKRINDFNLFNQTLKNGMSKQYELTITHKDGHNVPIAIRIAPMYDSKDEIAGATQLFTDNRDHLEHLVTDSEEYQQSYIDPVTKLPNKASIEMSIDIKLSEYRRYNRPFGLLFFEIDNFEKLDNIYGDEFDENVLTTISELLLEDIRPFDIAGSWSEKEFAIVLVNVDEDSVKIIANRLIKHIENINFTIGKGSLDITLSIGGIIATVGFGGTGGIIEQAIIIDTLYEPEAHEVIDTGTPYIIPDEILIELDEE